MSKILDVRHSQKLRHPVIPEDRQVRRVLLLALTFFISGLLFFVVRMNDSHNAFATTVPIQQESRPAYEAPRSPLSNLPDPTSYRAFQYHPGMESLDVSFTCEDLSAVALLYQTGVDYRADPQSALYNTATPCAKGSKFTAKIPLAPLHLVDGNRYYLIRAQEGKGTWYNPY